MKIDRRNFLSGLASGAALAGAGGCVGARGGLFGGGPDLRFGVLSDVHLARPGDEDTFLNALRYFRDNGADAVLIAGDIADWGHVEQLMRCGACWQSVFPGNRAPDGRHVEKLFIYGNHDVQINTIAPDDKRRQEAHWESKYITPENRARVWEWAFGEKYEPVWIKTVKGYRFVGAHWCNMGDAPAFLAAHKAELKGPRPFFYTQHAHPKDTCIGAWAWGHDGGGSTKALSAFPNAVAFSGHSHYSLTDERTVWQGAFTSINTASLRYASTDYNLRDNMPGNGSGYCGMKRNRAMSNLPTGEGRQGMLVSVYGNVLFIERRDFVKNASLGDDWVVPIPGGEEQTFRARAAKRSAPEFAPGAVAMANVEKETVTVSFPPARTVAKCRVFEYEVSAKLVEDDVDLVVLQRRVMAPDFFRPETRSGMAGICTLPRADLPYRGHYVFTVRPVECFGKKGAAISTKPIVL